MDRYTKKFLTKTHFLERDCLVIVRQKKDEHARNCAAGLKEARATIISMSTALDKAESWLEAANKKLAEYRDGEGND